MIRTLAKEMERLSVQVILRADVKQILTEDLETPDDGARESKIGRTGQENLRAGF